ncbi:Gfo/Idh/MocA family oxidoreductase [Microbacterium rhizomatis]|uniref:Oxidoreductase n=1 Tax=Microbacterium rhizomatis TaxID=1631477 RepID=A0A5J5IWS3_9MICO|nr:Gfo/Idh/MocA family oxidoreductase [Microbacterium rhizomatis]KAA9105547.1 oxidoreductase [Microbacterium rhizomatis]
MTSIDAAATRHPIRTAIVGYGLSGKVFHGPFVKADDDFEVSAIVTSDSARRADALVDHPQARVYSTFDQLLDTETDLDLVILSSPPDTHVDFAARALSRGAAVIVDKPFVATVDQARTLEQAAAAAGRPLMVFHNRRWDGDFLTLQRLLAEGMLGEVFAFESAFEHWAPVATSGWKDQLPASDGGGVAYDLGSHLIDQALVLFGPAEVRSASVRSVRHGGNDDHTRIDLRHESGVESSLLMSRVSRGLGPRFRVLGTKGSFTSAGLDGQEPALVAGVTPSDPSYGVTPESGYGTLEAEGPDGMTTLRVPMERGDYPEFYRRAARAIREGGAEPVSLEDAIAVVRLLEVSTSSAETRASGAHALRNRSA